MASAPRRRRRGPTADAVALAAALIPIVLAAVRFIADGRIPDNDAGYFTARSLDVFTPHHPFVGAWTTFSFLLGDDFNNLGPIQLWTLRPFTSVDPFAGMAVGVGLVNVAAVVATWFAARHLFGRLGVVGVMAATVALQLSFGGDAWIDARQQLALLLPFWAFVWLSAALLIPQAGRLPIAWVFFGSLLLQTHFSYAYVGVALVVVAATGYVVVNRAWGRGRERRIAVTAAAVAIALWSHTIWDQLFGRQNLQAVLSHAGGRESAGSSRALLIMGETPFGAPWRIGSSVERFNMLAFGSVNAWDRLLAIAWISALVLIALRMSRRRPAVAATALVAVIAFVALWMTTARMSEQFEQNYFPLWPASLVAATALAAFVAPMVRPPAVTASVTALVAAALALFWTPTSLRFDEWALPAELTTDARRILDEMDRRIDEYVEDGVLVRGEAVVVEPSRSRVFLHAIYSVYGQLIDNRIGMHFTGGADDLQRFGVDRCEDGDERWRLRLAVGTVSPDDLPEGALVLAERRGVGAEAREEFSDILRRFRDMVAVGSIRIDIAALERADERLARSLQNVLAEPDQLHLGLLTTLRSARHTGAVELPPGVAGDLERGAHLTYAVLAGSWYVILVPNDEPQDSCPHD